MSERTITKEVFRDVIARITLGNYSTTRINDTWATLETRQDGVVCEYTFGLNRSDVQVRIREGGKTFLQLLESTPASPR